jgi:hypothetical protein
MPRKVTLVMDTNVFEKHEAKKKELDKTWEEYFIEGAEGFYAGH